MKIGNRFFDTKNHTYIMGILNVTPDSFSDGGKWKECANKKRSMSIDGSNRKFRKLSVERNIKAN